MNILIIDHYAGSIYYGMEYRPYYLAKEWIKLGHAVSIVSASYSHLRMHQPDIKRSLSEEDVDGIKYYWIRVRAYRSSSLKRVINMLSFVVKLLFSAKKIAQVTKPDVVIASSTYPLDIYPSILIAKMRHARLCYEVHDIWPLSPMVIGGYSKWNPFIVTMQIAEDMACRSCDKLVSLLWNSESHFLRHGLQSGKFCCVPNGFIKEEWIPEKFLLPLPVEHVRVLTRLKSESKLIVGFAGGFAAAGSLTTLIMAANELKGNIDIAFLLVGKGPEERLLRSMVKDKNLNNVFFLPPIAKELIPSLDSQFDVAFIGGVHSILHRYGTSSVKLTDYMLSSLPIVQAMDEPGSVVERVRCGIRVEAENFKAVAEAIFKLSKLSENERHSIGARGREYTLANLEYGFLAKKFVDFLRK